MNFDKIRGVLFDVDGTLYRQQRLRLLMGVELLTMPLSRPAKAPRTWRALQAYRTAQEHLRGSSAAGAAGAQLAAAAARSGLPVAEIEDLVAEWMMKRPLKYLQFCRAGGLDRLLDLVDRAGLRAGILSDYPAGPKLQALGVEGRFSPVLCTTDTEIDALKPHPRGYLRACDIWNLQPSEVLVIGDRAEVDAAGATAAGMPCVIIGRAGGGARDYLVLPSLERLRHVLLDRR